MPTIFYFGAWSKDQLGHHLHAPGGSTLRRHEQQLPFMFHVLDGALLDPHKPQEEGRFRVVKIGGWTVLTFWDRSADGRGQSNSAFVVEGDRGYDEVIRLAREAFPAVFARFTFDLRPD